MIFFSMTQRSEDRRYLYGRMKIVIISDNAIPVLFPVSAADCIHVRTIKDLAEHQDADLYIDLDFTIDPARLSALSLLLPSLVIVNAVTSTIAELGYPFIRINGWPGFLEREIHELAAPDEETAGKITAVYESLGRSCRIVPDTPGLITARILATIINEAWYTWEQGVSTKEEIDTAMKLGTNYPLGPFEWSERIGITPISLLLAALSKTDPGYAPANSLQQAAGSLKYD
jgi:3-hydroxybutyryl-CoA dehydrogenase